MLLPASAPPVLLKDVYKRQKLIRVAGERLGLSGNRLARAERAAGLCKADLVTSMVRELPELQGVMGREYALRSGEEAETARAIYEHYLPRHAGDELPGSIEGALLSLVDRADTLSGSFAVGLQPTGSEDPYALRRQAQGIISILLEHEFEITPAELLETALRQHGEALSLSAGTLGTLRSALHEFMAQRLRFALQGKGLSYDVVDAVLAVPYRSLAELQRRAFALEERLQMCIRDRPYDVEKGAGTMNPATFLRALGPEPWAAAYVEPSRRPTDGRYG